MYLIQDELEYDKKSLTHFNELCALIEAQLSNDETPLGFFVEQFRRYFNLLTKSKPSLSLAVNETKYFILIVSINIQMAE